MAYEAQTQVVPRKKKKRPMLTLVVTLLVLLNVALLSVAFPVMMAKAGIVLVAIGSVAFLLSLAFIAVYAILVEVFGFGHD